MIGTKKSVPNELVESWLANYRKLDGNTCNGKSQRTRKGELGELPIDIAGGEHGSFRTTGEGTQASSYLAFGAVSSFA